MTPEAIRDHLHKQPFVPFRIFFSDGSCYEVRRPGLVLVTRREVVIALPKPGEEFRDTPSIATRCTLPGSNRLTAPAQPVEGRWRNSMSDFVICVDNASNPASLILGKVYRRLPDAESHSPVPSPFGRGLG